VTYFYCKGKVVQVYGSGRYPFHGDSDIKLYVVEETENHLKGYEAEFDAYADEDDKYFVTDEKVVISKLGVNGYKIGRMFPEYQLNFAEGADTQ